MCFLYVIRKSFNYFSVAAEDTKLKVQKLLNRKSKLSSVIGGNYTDSMWSLATAPIPEEKFTRVAFIGSNRYEFKIVFRIGSFSKKSDKILNSNLPHMRLY